MKSNCLFLFVFILFFANSCTKQKSNEFFIDVEGNRYRTVKIGDKIWMAENLKVTVNPKGEKLDCVLVYRNDQNNIIKYGRLYRWTAAMQACPEGWHMPTKTEWEQLVEMLGGVEQAGAKLKSLETWDVPNTGASNETGFSGLAAGFEYDGKFIALGKHGDFWGMISDTASFSVCLYHDGAYIKLMEDNDREVPISFSVRYVKNRK